MPLNNPVSLQISLSPGDYPMAKYLLSHQLKQLSGQVDEIILTVDTQPSKGRFAEGWQQYQTQLNTLLQNDIQSNFNVQVIPVDYSPPVKANIAAMFFEGGTVPGKDFRGGPFYAYFFGLYKAKNNLVFHLDADIFLGGGSPNWIKEAVRHFENDPSLFIVSPLPGPPHAQDILIGQSVIQKPAPYTFQLEGMSTRLFMLNKSLLKKHKLLLSKPGIRNQIKAIIEGNPNANLPEHILSANMKSNGLKRIDFLGSGAGLWSLHPPYRTASFYHNLQQLIQRVEQNDLPHAQQGFYDMVDEVCDWTEAREKLKQQRWWKRLINKN
jgi:hypothetical protein